MSVVRDFCGHGLGRLFHDEPNIVHVGRPGEGIVLEPGMFFTVEPMINLGRPHVKVLSDGWTAVTRDRSLSAQFEHTVGVTETGVEIFTLSPAGLDRPRFTVDARARAPFRAACKPSRCKLRSGRHPGGHGGAVTIDGDHDSGELLPRRAALSRPSRAAARSASATPAPEALSDYELLELVLFRAIPQRDVKPLAKDLIAHFGSFAEVIAAPPARLLEVKGIGDAAITELKIVHAAAQRLARGTGAASGRCCRHGRACSTIAAPRMAFADKEQFRILFLDKRNQLIADEVQQSRHRRPHAGLSARGGQARARTVGDRDHPRAQPPVRRSDALARRHPDDAGDHRRGEAARHRRARPHHRRQGRPRQPQGAEADLIAAIHIVNPRHTEYRLPDSAGRGDHCGNDERP